jgi:predicted nucleic acid-binding protein
VSTEILSEYAEILERYTSPEFSEAALGVITNNPYTLFVTPYYHFHLIKADPDDDKFVDCAVACNARFVVTDDTHFDVLKKVDFPKVDVIGLDEIIQQINNK